MDKSIGGVSFVGFGGPIVDVLVYAELNPDIANDIVANLKYHMDEDLPIEFFKSVVNSNNVEHYLGGSGMNTTRMINHLIKSKEVDDKIAFLGSIGDDYNGKLISDTLAKEGVHFLNEVFKDGRTSTIIVLVEKNERTFYGDLGSSISLTSGYINEIIFQLKQSKYFYADAYLLGKLNHIYKMIYENIYQEPTQICLCLGSENVVRDFFDYFMEVWKYLDIVFTNQEEMEVMRVKSNFPSLDEKEFLVYLGNLEKENKRKERIIINTRGSKDAYIFISDIENNTYEIKEIPIVPVDKDKIVDTNGAGDTFSAGFISGLLLGYDYEKSGHLGMKMASRVIQMKGFQLPDISDV